MLRVIRDANLDGAVRQLSPPLMALGVLKVGGNIAHGGLLRSGLLKMSGQLASADERLSGAHKRRLHGARGKESAANIDLHARVRPAQHTCERDGAFKRR